MMPSLRDPQVRLLTLTCTGGIGKIRLAVEAPAVLGSDFPDGVCFISVAQTLAGCLARGPQPRMTRPVTRRPG
jgi:hypothetical protein